MKPENPDKAEAAPGPPHPTRLLFWLVLASLLHVFIWNFQYARTPLGESPALDNRQTLILAEQMATGTLPEEPFHRAPLYPALLAFMLKVGMPAEALPTAARVLNAIAIAIMTAGTAWLAWGLGGVGTRRHLQAILAGGLVGLNPVILFFSGDAFDILPAAACLVAALVLLTRWLSRPGWKTTLAIGLLLAAGAALRSHILPLALIWPAVAAVRAGWSRRAVSHAASACAGPALGFILLGLANLTIAGEFRMMPWQGSYNLWAGNRPGADGRIYRQVIPVRFGETYDNPAKLESLALYERETGKSPPHDISEMNHYWLAKTRRHIQEHPLEWAGLMVRKAYYFLNSYEQYDNKTYSFHRARHLQLRINPIHWGLIWLLATIGAFPLLANRETRGPAVILIGVFLVSMAGTILFYTSNRFRVPMIPVLCVLAAGVFHLPAVWRRWKSGARLAFAASIMAAALLTYSSAFQARDRSTWEEDYAMMAKAALRTGRDAEARDFAEAALDWNPRRYDVLAVLAQVRFNAWALSNSPQMLSRAEAEAFLEEVRLAARADPGVRVLIGVYQWKLGYHDAAVQIWTSLEPPGDFANLLLQHTATPPPPGSIPPETRALLEVILAPALPQANR